MFNYQFNFCNVYGGNVIPSLYAVLGMLVCGYLQRRYHGVHSTFYAKNFGFVGKIINVIRTFNWSCRSYSLHLSRCARGPYNWFLTFSIDQLPKCWITLFYQRYSWLLVPLQVSQQPSYFILIAGKLKGDSHESHFIHKFEVPIMVTELGLLICFFVGLHFGGGQKSSSITQCSFWLLGCSVLDWGILNW